MEHAKYLKITILKKIKYYTLYKNKNSLFLDKVIWNFFLYLV